MIWAGKYDYHKVFYSNNIFHFHTQKLKFGGETDKIAGNLIYFAKTKKKSYFCRVIRISFFNLWRGGGV